MKLYDLTHLLNNESTVYPGISSPEFNPVATIEKNGYRETHFKFHSHLGTHIDAPSHMLKNGLSLDKLNVHTFWGKALIVQVPDGADNIEKDLLQDFSKNLTNTDFVLFKTDWSRFWSQKRYFEAFPVLNSKALEFLLSFQLKGIGFDTISADSIDSKDYKNHYAIFEKGLIIIENLIFPKNFNETVGEFSCFPLYYENADGSPVRAILKAK